MKWFLWGLVLAAGFGVFAFFGEDGLNKLTNPNTRLIVGAIALVAVTIGYYWKKNKNK
jgi:uncharacterized membrane protein